MGEEWWVRKKKFHDEFGILFFGRIDEGNIWRDIVYRHIPDYYTHTSSSTFAFSNSNRLWSKINYSPSVNKVHDQKNEEEKKDC